MKAAVKNTEMNDHSMDTEIGMPYSLCASKNNFKKIFGMLKAGFLPGMQG